MEPLVILSQLEQEYLLRGIEASLRVHDPRSFFLWTQGQLQALLPHDVMVGLQFGPHGELERLECWHGTVLAAAALDHLCSRAEGLALRLAHAWRQGPARPAVCDLGCSERDGVLGGFQAELEREGYGNVLVHGTGETGGGGTVFVLLRLPLRPGARHGYFLELLLPHLHLALLRLGQGTPVATDLARPMSGRELEILRWVREGKSNYEIACILGISDLTVKNHLQRIYRTLGVSNRTQAVSRGLSLRLLDRAA